ncbi:MAG: 1,4-dihydroxy-2-naphthoate octaprenyltransferase [Bacteroidaceae bacterium]|nr:1,4-dihydroxy-2-naphthoate octaprenyltransferase [Bacteroidaceae bacterium]
MIRSWIEAMRLRTLPVSMAGVIAGTGCAIMFGSFKGVPALLCLVFAMLAQIASNFGNEYYDFKNGIDRKGRDGFRRGVTEGEISPESMKRGTFATLILAAIVGCVMLIYGPWWLVVIGALIMMFALAYSAGPYPLSHHGLGDLAVIIFFGIVPVIFTCYLQTGTWECINIALPTSIAVGLLAANVLIVNNYRDMEDDASVGKRTTVVIFGRRFMSIAYLLSGIVGMAVMIPVWLILPLWSFLIPLTYLLLHLRTWIALCQAQGAELNPLLGKTAINLLLFALMFLTVCILTGLSMDNNCL